MFLVTVALIQTSSFIFTSIFVTFLKSSVICLWYEKAYWRRGNVPFLYPQKMSENLWFSNVFRKYRNETLVWFLYEMQHGSEVGWSQILPRVWLHFGLVLSRFSYLFWPNWRLNLHGLKIDCQSICAHLSLHNVFWKVSYHCEAWLFIPGRKRRKQRSIVH